MKAHIQLAAASALSLASFTAQAQTEATTTNSNDRKPGFTIGMQSTAGLTMADRQHYRYDGPTARPNTGTEVFARYFFNKHLAVEGGIGVSMYSRVSSNVYLYDKNLPYGYQAVNIKSKETRISIPVNLQYHLGNTNSKLRPYFGIGGGIKKSSFNSNSSYPDELFGDTRTNVFLQVSQGFTYQINKHWQINESINIQQSYGTSVQFKIGVGYRFK